MTIAEYLEATETNLHQLSLLAGIAYGTLHRHVKHGGRLSVATAKKLETATQGRISAAAVLGVSAKKGAA